MSLFWLLIFAVAVDTLRRPVYRSRDYQHEKHNYNKMAGFVCMLFLLHCMARLFLRNHMTLLYGMI